VRIDVQTGGSTRGLVDARRGTADIGVVSRALLSDESDVVAHRLALDGVTLIVHGDNPVKELTTDDIH
jgi:phosphate transport system substrate-binding protein